MFLALVLAMVSVWCRTVELLGFFLHYFLWRFEGMKMEVLKNEKNMAEFKLEGERHTFPGLLRQKLLEDKSVEYVSYVLDHPMDGSARFVLKTSGKSPKKALEDAAKEIEAELDEFGSKVKKVMK